MGCGHTESKAFNDDINFVMWCRYAGCYDDPAGSRQLSQMFCGWGSADGARSCVATGPEIIAGWEAMTPALCATICRDNSGTSYKYFGVQAGGECYCGTDPGDRADDGDCDSPCRGDPSMMCGGDNCNTVYSLPYLPPTDYYYSGMVAALRDDGMYLIELTDGNTTWSSLGRGGAILDVAPNATAQPGQLILLARSEAPGSWLEALTTQEPGGTVVAQPLQNLSQRLPVGVVHSTRALCYN
jgi:hypothetical protein